MTRPYAVTLTLTLYTEAANEDAAADRVEDDLAAALPRRALWRVEEVTPEALTRTLNATELTVLRGMLP
jgi:hypothetical protein